MTAYVHDLFGETKEALAIAEEENTGWGPNARFVEEREPRDDAERAAWKAWYAAREKTELPATVKATRKSKRGIPYVTLEDVLDCVREPLRKAGFVIKFTTFSPEVGLLGVRTVLRHKDGWFEQSEMVVPMDRQTGKGSAHEVWERVGWDIAFIAKYCLLGLLGMCQDTRTAG